MNTKISKILMMILCLSLCLALAVGCDTEDEPTAPEATTPATTTTTAATVDGLAKTEWDAKFTDNVFQNYTVIFEGRMSVTEDGAYDSTSDVWQKIKVTADKMEITIRVGESGVPGEPGEFTMALDGEAAEAEKIQNSQLFLSMLRKYENFKYDAVTKTYIIPEPIVLNEVLKATHGDGTLFDVPTRIEMREAVVSFAENGMISTFVCDYSQTMDMGNQVVNTSGKTTWTFLDFGTTVIE